VLGLRKPAATSEVTQDATVEASGELDDVLVGERLGRARARVDPVEHQRMEVKVQVEGAAEALHHHDRARAAGVNTRALGTLPQPPSSVRTRMRRTALQSLAS